MEWAFQNLSTNLKFIGISFDLSISDSCFKSCIINLYIKWVYWHNSRRIQQMNYIDIKDVEFAIFLPWSPHFWWNDSKNFSESFEKNILKKSFTLICINIDQGKEQEIPYTNSRKIRIQPYYHSQAAHIPRPFYTNPSLQSGNVIIVLAGQ